MVPGVSSPTFEQIVRKGEMGSICAKIMTKYSPFLVMEPM
jgi:hypothetical protein